MSKKQNFLFIVGMFRSGTTLLARALNAHPNLIVASDPFFEFFRAIRNEVYRKNKTGFDDDNTPLFDNFFSTHQSSVDEIQDIDFNFNMTYQKWNQIKKSLIKRGGPFSPKVMPLIKKVNEKNYKKLFIELMDLLNEAYPKEGARYLGIKEVWCEEFVKPLINTYPSTKCVHIVRDPRAIIASNKKRGTGRYPLLFLIRHWRKSCYYALKNQSLKKNIFLVKYEDLIDRPEFWLKKICKFLNVPFSPAVCDGDQFKDGSGKPWSQNSSYGTSKAISNQFKDQWKKVLTKKETQFVEDLCEREMKLFNYKRITKSNTVDSCLNPPAVDEKTYADWIFKYSSTFETSVENMTQELLRHLVTKEQKLSVKKANKLQKEMLKRLLVN